MSDRFTQTRAEVTAWFFEDYLPRWVSASSGATDESPEFILDYWGVPMHVSLPDKSTWFLDAKGVLSFLEMNRAPSRRLGTLIRSSLTVGCSSTISSVPPSKLSGRAGAPMTAKSSAGRCTSKSPSQTKAGA
jgi:hypothetical protein